MSIGEWEGEYIEFLAGGRPDLSREHFLRDVNGKPLGGTPLQTRLDWLARLDAVWNAAESKPAQTQAALARGLYRMAGSADTLAERIGRQDALAVLQAAGYDPGPVARRWDDHGAAEAQAAATSTRATRCTTTGCSPPCWLPASPSPRSATWPPNSPRRSGARPRRPPPRPPCLPASCTRRPAAIIRGNRRARASARTRS